MNIGNCKGCNIPIKYDKIPVCKDCLENYTKLAKDYIRENGESSPQEIKDATGVPIKVTEYLIETGTLYKTNEDGENTLSPENDEEVRRIENIKVMRQLKNELVKSHQQQLEQKKDNQIHFHSLGSSNNKKR